MISGQVSASSTKNFDKAMASAMAFSSMFPDGQTQITQKAARTAEKHLSKAVKYASKLDTGIYLVEVINENGVVVWHSKAIIQ